MNWNVVRAIFKRNFYAYFSNPTGYVFICVFVVLSSSAAFWPHDFFNNNLSNLDQLNKYLPLILLAFVPAITMSIWAEERRQGTDELLLTIPAGDFDVVLGKYLAAVAIYSVSLLFSYLCNFSMLSYLGRPDWGLIVATYVGYWMMGLTMLAIGMVASFLSSNLTVAFILGALFNTPLVLAAYADLLFGINLSVAIKRWSLTEQFRDFGRGVISLGGMVYFTLIIVAMLYVSMVLISRRHWSGGHQGKDLRGHYFVRVIALLLIVAGVAVLCERYPLSNVRADITYGRLSSLAPETRKILAELDPKQPIRIDAFVSPEVPESMVQTRLNLLSTLRELKAASGGRIEVWTHPIDPASEEAARAEKTFGIKPRSIITRSRGTAKQEEVFMGVAVSSGLKKVVIPFISYGIPVEYELVRSVATVAQQERKTLGVVTTEAKLFGGFDPNTMQPQQQEAIIDELEKQYEVKKVDPSKPISDTYDVLLAVQPSTLGPAEMRNFIDAVKSGIPTAIFEDPMPWPSISGGVTASSAPRQSPQNPMMPMGQQTMPKGNMEPLWKMLGINYANDQIIYYMFNPFPRLQDLPPELVFVDASDRRQQGEPFNQQDEITSKLNRVAFFFPGSFAPIPTEDAGMKFEALATTGDLSGYEKFGQMYRLGPLGLGLQLNPRRTQYKTSEEYVLAAHIRGKLKEGAAAPATLEKTDETSKPDKPHDREINVVVVADIDCMYSMFFSLREQVGNPDEEFTPELDNVTLVLNILDVLAGDDRFVEIRKRRPAHQTLQRIDEATEEAQKDADNRRQKLKKEFEDEMAKVSNQLQDKQLKIAQRTDLSRLEKQQRLANLIEVEQRRIDVRRDTMQRKLENDQKEVDRDLAETIRKVQNRYKFVAVVLPPILPLLVGLGVFFSRRAREREGVSRNRLR